MNSTEAKEASRREILSLLAKKPFQKPESTNFCHGRFKHFLPNLEPRVTWRSKEPPRGSGGPGWLTATEQRDRPEVLQDKVRYLAHLLSCSRHTVVLTGAGTSTSAGVRQTARGSTGQGYQGKLPHPTSYYLSHQLQDVATKAGVSLQTPVRTRRTWH